MGMSSDSSLLDTPEVHWPVLRQETPMECPPAPTSTLTPTVCSRPSTMLPTPSTDSRSPAPTSQLDQLPQRLHPLLPQPSTQNLSLPQSLTELPQSQSKTPQRSQRPRPPMLSPWKLPPPLLLRERDVMLTRRLLQQLLLFLLVSHTLVFPLPLVFPRPTLPLLQLLLVFP